MASDRRTGTGPSSSWSSLGSFFQEIDLARLDTAVNKLKIFDPLLSASGQITPCQGAIIAALIAAFLASVFEAATGHETVLLLILILPFTMIVLIRLVSLMELVRPLAKPMPCLPCVPDEDLPFYSVLVPVYRETDVASSLVAAMRTIDYPAHKLEILFLTEDNDAATRLALHSAELMPHMRVVILPLGEPQTKPRALNYGLQLTQGEIVAVFDAEDIPDPDQLRLAAGVFANAEADLACVQAHLKIYNPNIDFFTRQFTFEYGALFGAILPALERYRIPLPLAGTSNHFRRTALEEVGAWDPFNVTEDADLGFRLARFGKRVAMLQSVTYEEAPSTFQTWLGQRTRWLKGWMQTYLVHMRRPGRLWRELGPKGFLGFQAILGGMIFSALVHPWFFLAALFLVAQGQSILPSNETLWSLCAFNLGAGYISGITLVLMATRRSGAHLPFTAALLVPAYWLAISVASYLALYELFVRPYYWQKTPHRARPVTSVVSSA